MLRWLAVLLSVVAVWGEEAAFVTLTPKGAVRILEGEARARRRMSPCSTFKIPNSVIGLETGAIPAADFVIRYDEKKHRTGTFWVEAWGKDQDLQSAFRVSAVWYFRELAARVGPGTMKAFVERFGYGNRDTSAWEAPFWIGSTLRISPVEQVEFLDRLFRNEFGVQTKHLAAVEGFMRQEAQDGRVLHFKTGACTDAEAGPEVWLVGFVQNGAERTYFAFNVGGGTLNDLIARRMELVNERLSRHGLWRR